MRNSTAMLPMAVSLSAALGLLIFVRRTAPLRDSGAALLKAAFLETNQRCSIEYRHDPATRLTNFDNLSHSPKNADPLLETSRREPSRAEALPASSFNDFDYWIAEYLAA